LAAADFGLEISMRPDEQPSGGLRLANLSYRSQNDLARESWLYHQLTLSYWLNKVVLTVGVGIGITIAPTLGEAEA
jgi:hypothetical protein